MAEKEGYRIFVGGLAWDIDERQLENAFSRYGRVLDAQKAGREIEMDPKLRLTTGLTTSCGNDVLICYNIMLERDTGRPRGFGFITFADRRGMDDAIREMHGRELGDRTISVNKAEPKMGDDVEHGTRGVYRSGGRESYRGGDKPAGEDDCFKCGRPGHWARDCPSSGGRGGSFSSRPRFGGNGYRGDRFGERPHYIEEHYEEGRFGVRENFESRDNRYGNRDRFVNDRYAAGEDHVSGSRYGGGDRFLQNGYGRERGYEREGGPRGGNDQYGSGGPVRDARKSFRHRSGPYDRPSRVGRPSSFERY